MAEDRDYFRRRAADARASAFTKDECEDVEVAGHLALAYRAIARRRAAAAAASAEVDPAAASIADPVPLLLND